MERYVVIYNPSSGRQMVQNKVFDIARKVIEKKEVEVTFYATKKKDDAMKAAERACLESVDLIIACGGDGTISEIINGMMRCEYRPKLALLPAGTVNDFARHLKIPRAINAYVEMLENMRFKEIDVCKAEDNFFINVAAGGAFTNIPHEVLSESKTILGKYAYYLKGIVEAPEQIEKSYNLKIELDEENLELDGILFLIGNTSSIGGFKQIIPEAEYNDGLMDLLVIEKGNKMEYLEIFAKIVTGEHINHPKVHYYQSSRIVVDTDDDIVIDVDGELGANIPMTFELIHKAIEILVP